MTVGVLSDVNSCQAEQLSSMGKVLKMTNLLVKAHNQICDKVNNSFAQNESRTADQIYRILRNICSQAGIKLDHDTSSKLNIQPLKIEQSDMFKAQLSVASKDMGHAPSKKMG